MPIVSTHVRKDTYAHKKDPSRHKLSTNNTNSSGIIQPIWIPLSLSERDIKTSAEIRYLTFRRVREPYRIPTHVKSSSSQISRCFRDFESGTRRLGDCDGILSLFRVGNIIVLEDGGIVGCSSLGTHENCCRDYQSDAAEASNWLTEVGQRQFDHGKLAWTWAILAWLLISNGKSCCTCGLHC